MTALVVQSPAGIAPKLDPRALPSDGAQTAENCALWSGHLRPLYGVLAVNTPSKSGTKKAFFRMDDNAGGGDYWLHWTTYVDVIRTPLEADTTQRIYYTGDYEPRVTNYEMASAGTDTIDGSDNYPSGYGDTGTDYPLAYYALGIPNAHTAPTVTASGGVAANATRVYVYTYVDAWGEESGESPPTTITDKADATYTLTNMDTAPLNTGSIVAASHSSGVVTVETSGFHFIKPYHRIGITGVVGMTDLNADFTVATVTNIAAKTTNRQRTSNVATLTLDTVAGLAVGMTVVISNVGGTGYNGTVVLTGVTAASKTITYASVAADEGSTADTAGQLRYSAFTVSLTTAQTYTSGGTWKRKAPWNVTNMTKRIYRTVTTSGETNYLFVAEIDAATTTYADSFLDADLSVPIATLGFDVPPGNLHHIITLPNGIVAGLAENCVYFSEPYLTYAWPPEYVLTTDYPGQSTGVIGTNLIVPTSTVPYAISGIHPSSMSMEKHSNPFPCLSQRGTVSMGYGVIYVTDRGLAMVSPGGVDLVTQPYYDREDWQTLVNASDIRAMAYDGRYYAFWTDSEGNGKGLIFDPTDERSTITTVSGIYTAVFADPESDNAYVVDSDGVIGQWDSDDSNKMTASWKSKKFKLPKPLNYGAAIIDADFEQTEEEIAAIEAANATIVSNNETLIASTPSGANKVDPVGGALGSSELAEVSVAGDLLTPLIDTQVGKIGFTLFIDGSVKYNAVITNNKMFRLPAGYKSDTVEFSVSGPVAWHSVKMAETAKGLEVI